MGMPKLLKSIEKVDDYTVRITLNQPRGAVPLRPSRWAVRPRSSRRNMPTRCSRPRTPEKIDQDPIGTGPFYLLQYQKDAVIRYRAFPPHFWGGKAKIDDLIYSITPDASVRWAKLQKNEMSRDAVSEPGWTSTRSGRTRTCRSWSRRASNVGYLAFQTTKKPFDDVRGAQGDQHGDRQEGDHRLRSICRRGVAAKKPNPAIAVVPIMTA